ncbi:predicted protein [Botrytis cinerea T4]|uniref:Uncharacterized protein n=1 Tax=Botryotinia fuckeliana (strain T4) TaxID=999810 RepID=G2XSG0_BOTF4|nr:predicted protein [Botrytis cinerea T4]
MCKSKALQFFISENDRTEQTFYVIALGFFQLEIFHNLVWGSFNSKSSTISFRRSHTRDSKTSSNTNLWSTFQWTAERKEWASYSNNSRGEIEWRESDDIDTDESTGTCYPNFIRRCRPQIVAKLGDHSTSLEHKNSNPSACNINNISIY